MPPLGNGAANSPLAKNIIQYLRIGFKIAKEFTFAGRFLHDSLLY